MNEAIPSSLPPPLSLERAKEFLAAMNEKQLAYLTKAFNEQKQKEKREQEIQLVQQQAILDSLSRQVPITVDVMRSSTSPHSQTSSSSSALSSVEEEEAVAVTVKEVVIGKLKTHFKATAQDPNRPYRPRGSRERIFFEGHLFLFDKMSYDAKKRFYRCERRNTCPARIHTPVDSDRVIHRVQTHNHPPPQFHELQHYDIDYGKVRGGHIMQLVTTRSSASPSSQLSTPKAMEKPMDILNKMISNQEDSRRVTLRLPDLFYTIPQKETDDIEMALTRFLLQQEDLRKEFMKSDGDLPVFFPDAKDTELILFVADHNLENPAYEMIQVKERNEASIRSSIEGFLKSSSTRPLRVNVSAKISVPLSQQMIDQWKTEMFIRIDASKCNSWQIHYVQKVDN
uniref:FLYWCH-type domain-containing protein n=1 Tax=Caenorhabditis tropicalis TaxID=1561998 RepID=A0A1I7U4V0_9PELO